MRKYLKHRSAFVNNNLVVFRGIRDIPYVVLALIAFCKFNAVNTYKVVTTEAKRHATVMNHDVLAPGCGRIISERNNDSFRNKWKAFPREPSKCRTIMVSV